MQWISVKDRMPEKDEMILLYIDGDQYVGWLNSIKDKSFKTREYDSCCYGNDPSFDKVTHWMELPEKPYDNPLISISGDASTRVISI